MLEQVKARELKGRDTFSRYRRQVRSTAIICLEILDSKNVKRVYCEVHDDVVTQIKDGKLDKYIFRQVKTKDKQNHNWSPNELLGFTFRHKKLEPFENKDVKDSFIGKLLLHTINFGENCHAVIFQTNINTDDNVEEILSDIHEGKFTNQYTKILVEKFNEIFITDKDKFLEIEQIKNLISKIDFETDVQYLKNGDENFEPLARNKIYKFSEIDLSITENREILIQLLNLIENKTEAKIQAWDKNSIDKSAGICIDDLLKILSISKDGYNLLIQNGDEKAIKKVSILQRTLDKAGTSQEQIDYCIRCKIKWDNWQRENRHIVEEFKLRELDNKFHNILFQHGSQLTLSHLYDSINILYIEYSQNPQFNNITQDILLGGILATLVREKS